MCGTCEGSPQNCTSCPANSNRALDAESNSCLCVEGFYEDADGDVECEACSITCDTCISSSECLTCPASSHRTLTGGNCTCDVG